MALHSIIFLIILIAAFSFFGYNVKRLISYMKVGKPENRFDAPGKRLKNVSSLRLASRNYCASRSQASCTFLFLGIRYSPSRDSRGNRRRDLPRVFVRVSWPVVRSINFYEDLIGLLVIGSVLFALFRRYVTKPARLDVSGHAQMDATVILLMILFIMCTMFLQNAANIAAGTAVSGESRFFSNALAAMFAGGSRDNQEFWFYAFWLAAYLVGPRIHELPSYSKHLHIISSIPNVYFAKLGVRGKLKALNLQG